MSGAYRAFALPRRQSVCCSAEASGLPAFARCLGWPGPRTAAADALFHLPKGYSPPERSVKREASGRRSAPGEKVWNAIRQYLQGLKLEQLPLVLPRSERNFLSEQWKAAA